ncbi:MAG: peptide chain release factor N(5)-glutamine methyltransferase [Flavobacteriaceae bacterium]
MNLKNLRTSFFKDLKEQYPREELENIFKILIEDKYHIAPIQIALDPELTLGKENLNEFNKDVEYLKKHMPVQHITGKTIFCGLPFKVGPEVLIPRPETEELVYLIQKDLMNSKKRLKIIDLCTGSGCIAISLAKLLGDQVEVTALDTSIEALETAKQNATMNKVDIRFIKENLLSMSKLDQAYDIVVSNPPYVRDLEKKEIDANVLDYEPHLALFVKDNDPLIFYSKIGQITPKTSRIYFEINQYLGPQTKTCLEELGWDSVELIKDYKGNDRMIRTAF